MGSDDGDRGSVRSDRTDRGVSVREQVIGTLAAAGVPMTDYAYGTYSTQPRSTQGFTEKGRIDVTFYGWDMRTALGGERRVLVSRVYLRAGSQKLEREVWEFPDSDLQCAENVAARVLYLLKEYGVGHEW